MRDYEWSKATIRRGWLTLGEVADRLHVSPWTARRWLVRSGLPARLYTRYWAGPNGRVYRRRCWGVPLDTLGKLKLWRRHRSAWLTSQAVERIERDVLRKLGSLPPCEPAPPPAQPYDWRA